MEFKGWDFGELAEHFGIEVPDEVLNKEQEVEYIRKGITAKKKACFLGDWPAEVVEPCRAFLDKLAEKTENLQSSGSLWRGLAAIPDDWTFMKYFLVLLGHMWT